jgi:nucleotide-binding universal stress UspA family protein
VIVPVRSEQLSNATLNEAINLAESSDADVQLLGIVDSDETLATKAPSVGTSQGPPSHAVSSEWAAERRDEATRRLGRVDEQVRQLGFTGAIHREVREGWPSEVIAAAAGADEVVAIVIPTAPVGDEGFPPELAQTVAERANAPVVMVNELVA